jgi:hypothetical protein
MVKKAAPRYGYNTGERCGAVGTITPATAPPESFNATTISRWRHKTKQSAAVRTCILDIGWITKTKLLKSLSINQINDAMVW